MIVFSLLCCSFGMIFFLFFEAENIIDVGNSFYGAISGVVNLITLPVNILNADKVFKLIDRFEQIMKERKFFSQI